MLFQAGPSTGSTPLTTSRLRTSPSTRLRTSPSTRLRTSPSTRLRTGPSTRLRTSKKRGVSGITVLEYSLLLAVLAAAIMGSYIFLRRALSAQWKQSADSFGSGRQYDSSATTIN